MSNRETLVSFIDKDPELIAVLVKSPQYGTSWGVMRESSLDLYKELFPENEVLEIIHGYDADPS